MLAAVGLARSCLKHLLISKAHKLKKQYHHTKSGPAVTLSPFPRTPVPSIILRMRPTVFREGGFRFYFFSREESRMHVHVQGQSGEAKFWLEPAIELANTPAFQSAK